MKMDVSGAVPEVFSVSSCCNAAASISSKEVSVFVRPIVAGLEWRQRRTPWLTVNASHRQGGRLRLAAFPRQKIRQVQWRRRGMHRTVCAAAAPIGKKEFVSEIPPEENDIYAQQTWHRVSLERFEEPLLLGLPVRVFVDEELKRIVSEDRLEEGLLLLHDRAQASISVFAHLLQLCIKLGDVRKGRKVHDAIVKRGLENNDYLMSTLVRMYAQNGLMRDANLVFDKTVKKSAFCWTALAEGHAKLGQFEDAIKVIERMDAADVEPNSYSFVTALKACVGLRDWDRGQQIYEMTAGNELETDVHVASAIIDLYARCGRMQQAQAVFDKVTERDVVLWSTLIRGYIDHGNPRKALSLYDSMIEAKTNPDAFTFSSLLKACAILQDLDRGVEIHEKIISCGLDEDSFVGGGLVDMYAKCGSLEKAQLVFDNLPGQNVFAFTAMIFALAEEGFPEAGLTLFKEMHQNGPRPNELAFCAAIKACAGTGKLREARQVHSWIREVGLYTSLVLACPLIDMFAKCNSMRDAYNVFSNMTEKNMMAWNAINTAFAELTDHKAELAKFEELRQKGGVPDKFSCSVILKACSTLGAGDHGRWISEHILKQGYDSELYISCTLIEMFCKVGDLKDAVLVFDKWRDGNLAIWNAMIAGYAHLDQVEDVINLFDQMQVNGLKPDTSTIMAALKACSSSQDLEKGKKIQKYVKEHPALMDAYVGNAILDVYVKCGAMEEAKEVFNCLGQRTVVSWTTMISGYVQDDNAETALQLFEEMQEAGIQPDEITFVNVIKACTQLSLLEKGKVVHAEIRERNLESNPTLGSTLIDMYGKCGSIDDAQTIFDSLPERDVVSWTALMSGYAHQGQLEDTLLLFAKMEQEGVTPNEVTFTTILSACSHAGAVDKGFHFFKQMTDVYRLTPTVQHYACLVDGLGRGGHIVEALNLINSMPLDPGVHIWMSLLAACRKHSNVEIGTLAFENVLKIDATNPSPYLLMANIYASAGRLDDSDRVTKEMEQVAAKKEPGVSWVEHAGQVQSFGVGDTTYTESERIFDSLDELTIQLGGGENPESGDADDRAESGDVKPVQVEAESREADGSQREVESDDAEGEVADSVREVESDDAAVEVEARQEEEVKVEIVESASSQVEVRVAKVGLENGFEVATINSEQLQLNDVQLEVGSIA